MSSDDQKVVDIEQERVRTKVRQALLGAPPSGFKIGRFELRGWLGAGAMGLVYEAHDPSMDRIVALKVLDQATRLEHRKRLVREAHALARIRHPNVVTVFEARPRTRGRISMLFV